MRDNSGPAAPSRPALAPTGGSSLSRRHRQHAEGLGAAAAQPAVPPAVAQDILGAAVASGAAAASRAELLAGVLDMTASTWPRSNEELRER